MRPRILSTNSSIKVILGSLAILLASTLGLRVRSDETTLGAISYLPSPEPNSRLTYQARNIFLKTAS